MHVKGIRNVQNYQAQMFSLALWSILSSFSELFLFFQLASFQFLVLSHCFLSELFISSNCYQ